MPEHIQEVPYRRKDIKDIIIGILLSATIINYRDSVKVSWHEIDFNIASTFDYGSKSVS